MAVFCVTSNAMTKNEFKWHMMSNVPVHQNVRQHYISNCDCNSKANNKIQHKPFKNFQISINHKYFTISLFAAYSGTHLFFDVFQK